MRRGKYREHITRSPRERRKRRPRGFYTTTQQGHAIHVTGAVNMPEATLDALRMLMDKAIEQFGGKDEQP